MENGSTIVQFETPAQAMVGIGFNPETEAKYFRVMCADANDLEGCLKIIGRHNRFDAALILEKAGWFFKIRAYKKGDLFQFHIGRSGTPELLVTFCTKGSEMYQMENCRPLAYYSLANFEYHMKALKGEIKADQFQLYSGKTPDGSTYLTARFSWD